jgi:hypothetical protein
MLFFWEQRTGAFGDTGLGEWREPAGVEDRGHPRDAEPGGPGGWLSTTDDITGRGSLDKVGVDGPIVRVHASSILLVHHQWLVPSIKKDIWVSVNNNAGFIDW